MLTDTVNIVSFIKTNHITMSAERTDSNPSMPDSRDMDHWKCVLRMDRKRMTVSFSMGYGHHGTEPKVAGVLDCLSSDSASVDQGDFEGWCSDLGYETDSRKAERIYKACEHQAKRLRNFLGDDLYGELLYHTERM